MFSNVKYTACLAELYYICVTDKITLLRLSCDTLIRGRERSVLFVRILYFSDVTSFPTLFRLLVVSLTDMCSFFFFFNISILFGMCLYQGTQFSVLSFLSLPFWEVLLSAAKAILHFCIFYYCLTNYVERYRHNLDVRHI